MSGGLVSKPLVRRIEVWDKLACQASPAGLGAVDWIGGTIDETFEGLARIQRLTLTVPDATYYAGQLLEGRILRVLYVDGTFDEFRISARRDGGGRAGIVEITAQDILLDLAEQLTKVTTTVAGKAVYTSPAVAAAMTDSIDDWVLPYAPTYFARGTVTPTALAPPTEVGGMPLEVALALLAATNLAAGATYELQARRNGTTNYLLDVVAVGATAATAYLRSGLNLIEPPDRERARREQTTRGYILGTDNRGIGDAHWVVTAVSANVYIEIAPIDGEATNPIIADDVFNGTHSVYVAGVVTAYPITDTERATKRLHMNPTPASPVGKWVRIAVSGGNEVSYLDSPADQATYGVIVGDLTSQRTGRTNFTPKADAADWTGARPAGWTGGGTAPTKVTTAGDWETAGWSQRYASVASASTISPSALRYYTAGEVCTTMARIRVDNTIPGAHLLRFGNPNTGLAEDVLLDATFTEIGVWVYVVKQWPLLTSKLVNQTVGLHTGPGGGTTLFDHVLTVAGADVPLRFIRHSEAALLWLELIRHMETNGSPVLSIGARPADLTRLDATAYPNSDLAHGAAVVLSDPMFSGGSQSARIVTVRTNIGDPIDTTVQVANRRPELTRILAGRT